MPYMYILECCDGSYYTGSTWNLEKCLAKHQAGRSARHTAKRLPVRLVYCEEFSSIDEAFSRKRQVRCWKRKKRQALIDGDFKAQYPLSGSNNETSHLMAGFDSAQSAE